MASPYQWTHKVSKYLPFLTKFFDRREAVQSTPAKVLHGKRKTPLSSEKQADLQKLCEQLFKKKSLIISGKLQLIGLTSIKKKLGKQWAGLSEMVYEMTEEVMQNHLGKGDIFIRYRDDTYILIFAQADMEEAKQKTGAIAEDIRQRLFAMDEDELKSVEIRDAIRQIKTDFSGSTDFNDFLDSMSIGWEDEPWQDETYESDSEDDDEYTGPEPSAMDVNSASYRQKGEEAKPHDLANLACHYQPLWDVPRNALTTFLCLLHEKGEMPEHAVDKHVDLYKNQPPENILALDMFVLKTVRAELGGMVKDGRKLLVACPVHYDTLYRFEGYEAYKAQLLEITEEQKQFLVFYVTGLPDNLSSKDPFWFNVPMQQFGRQLIVELPLRRDTNFSQPLSAGIKAVAVRLEQNADEQETIKLLNNFSNRSTSFKMTMIAVLGVSTLSLTTSAVCAGFKLLGGHAIHDLVPKPDSVHRYRHEDLLKDLLNMKFES